jgi:hypothetical protein
MDNIMTESAMLTYLKTKNPDKVYPTNFYKNWTVDEENTILEELSKDMDISAIAEAHERTLGSITSRIKDIAYRMHIKSVSMEEIMQKTKLNNIEILDHIARKENQLKKKSPDVAQNLEIAELKTEIINLKKDIAELKVLFANYMISKTQ